MSTASQLFANVKCTLSSLPEAPQASYSAEGLYHVINRTALLQVENHNDGLPVSISALQCQACLIRPSCSSTLTFNHEDLVLTPEIDFCGTRPESFVATVKLTLSLAAVLITSYYASADLNVYRLARIAERLFQVYPWSLQLCPWKQWPTRNFAQRPNQFHTITPQFLAQPAVL